MPSFAGLGKFFGRTASEGAAFAAGVAVAPALEPVVEEVRQEAWSAHAVRRIGAETAAGIVAEGARSEEWGADEAKHEGISGDRFGALVDEALNAPGLGSLYDAWRRGLISDDAFEHGLRKMKLEPRWDAALRALKDERLDPAVVAAAIVRGLIADPGILPVGPPAETGKVPSFPRFNVDALAEAAAKGIDKERLSVLVGNYGRPMSPEAAAQSTFRGLIERVDFDRAISEGDVRNEWAEAIFEHARQIPSVVNFIEAFVRDWISRDEMLAGTRRHGMSDEDAQLVYLIHGRPLTHAQVFVGKLRGGVYDGPTDHIDPDYLKSLRESDMRPEWYNLAWAGRYHFPPFFQTVNALSKGWIDAATATDWLLKQAYDPEAVRTIVENVSGPKPGGTDRHASSAQTSLLTSIRRGYVKGTLTEAQATEALAGSGLSADSQRAVLDTWRKERQVATLESAQTPTPPAVT